MTTKKPNIFIAAGVTGGHILPMLYVAEKLEVKFNIIFIGTGRELEKKLILAKGYKLLEVDISGLHKLGVKGFINFFIKLPKALITCLTYFFKFRPKVVIGGGAYVSLVPVFCGYLFKVPIHLHEAEKKPGIANNFLSYFANSISVAYKDTKFKAKITPIFTGQPLNPKIENAIEEFKNREMPDKPINILILGGSQGSRVLDQAVIENIDFFKKEKLNIWHQCWHEDAIKVLNKYLDHNMSVKVEPFISDMLEAYKFADLIISRSGAGLTKEIGLLKIPSILIPLPGSNQNNHQLENARSLEELGISKLILQDQNINEHLKLTLDNIFYNNEYSRMITTDTLNEDLEASQKIADIIINLSKI